MLLFLFAILILQIFTKRKAHSRLVAGFAQKRHKAEMSEKNIDGNATAKLIRQEIAEQVQELKKHGITPGLAVVIVGNRPDSATYVKMKG